MHAALEYLLVSQFTGTAETKRQVYSVVEQSQIAQAYHYMATLGATSYRFHLNRYLRTTLG